MRACLLMRPLLRALARPMKEEWKMRPYFGVLPRVLSARNSAFSAPRICTVDDYGPAHSCGQHPRSCFVMTAILTDDVTSGKSSDQ